MTDRGTLVALLERCGLTYSRTPKGDCVYFELSEGFETQEWFFDAAGKFIRAALRKVATKPGWMDITPNTCGGGP